MEDLSDVKVNLFSADFQNAPNPETAFLYYFHQKSNKKSGSVHESVRETFYEPHSKALVFQHSSEAFAEHLRAHISTIVPSFKFSMDVQCSDGNGMLLKYVASYVSKFSDGINTEALFNHDFPAITAALRYLHTYKVNEPELILSLSNTSMSYTNSRCKTIYMPLERNIDDHKMLDKYRERPELIADMSFLCWLRKYDGNKAFPTPYKQGQTLVAVKYCSHFNNQYFLQLLLTYKAHRKTEDILSSVDNELPLQLRYFAAALCHLPHFFHNDFEFIKLLLAKEAHKTHHINNIINYFHAKQDMYNLWRLRVLTSHQLVPASLTAMGAWEYSNLFLSVRISTTWYRASTSSRVDGRLVRRQSQSFQC